MTSPVPANRAQTIKLIVASVILLVSCALVYHNLANQHRDGEDLGPDPAMRGEPAAQTPPGASAPGAVNDQIRQSGGSTLNQ